MTSRFAAASPSFDTVITTLRSAQSDVWPPCVLLVDDDSDQRATIATMLRAARCQVVEVDCSTALLDRLTSYALFSNDSPPPDLVVCSSGLPGLVESEVIEALSEIRSHTPVVLIACEEPADEVALRRIAASIVLTTPYDLAELRRIVLELMPDDVWQRGTCFG